MENGFYTQETVSELICTPVFSVSHLLYPRHIPSLWSCNILGFFQVFFCLFLLLSYIALSLCYIGDLCYQILDPVLSASCLKLKVCLSPAIVYSLYVVNVTVHMNLCSIVKCPHCRQPHSTVWTFFQCSQQCLGKIGGNTQKLGIQWEIGYAYTIYTER